VDNLWSERDEESIVRVIPRHDYNGVICTGWG